MLIQIRFLFLGKLARGFVFFVAVGSMEVEKQLISCGLGHEVRPALKVFDLVELHFHEIMNCFNVGLHAMCPWIDRVMTLAGQELNGSGVS